MVPQYFRHIPVVPQPLKGKCCVSGNLSERVFLFEDFIALPSHSKMVDIFYDNTHLDVGLVVIENWTAIFVNYNLLHYISL